MLKQLAATFLLTCFAFLASAQQKQDTTINTAGETVITTRTITPPADTPKRTSFAPKIKKEKVYKPDSTHIPSLAVKRSLIIPGWGQLYNRRWWKVPIIYGGLGLLGVAINYNQGYYQQFSALAKLKRRITIPKEGEQYYDLYLKYGAYLQAYPNTSSEQFGNASDGFRRNRDLAILGVLLAWGIQAVDAYIDAKFISSYTVDDNLSMKITPGLVSGPMYAANFNSTYIPAIKITFTVK